MSITPPHDVQAESQFLGALIVHPDLITQLETQISPDDLYLESHRLIYSTILKQRRQGVNRIDSLQIINKLQDTSQIEQVGGAPYIIQLAQDVLAPSNAPRYVQRIKKLALRRQLMEAAHLILEKSSQPVEDEGSFLRDVEENILRITSQTTAQGIASVTDLKEEFRLHIQSLQDAKGGLVGISSGFKELDRLSSGFKPGELIILAARPGMGKSTFALNLCVNTALRQKEDVLLFSLEMSHMELMMRLLCSEAQFEHSDLKRGHIPSHLQEHLLSVLDEICKAPIYIDDSGDLSIWDCVAKTRKFKLEQEQKGKKLGLVIIDYLQLMSDPEAKRLGRQHEVATISRNLKQLSRMIHVPILALSQMNRSVEQRRGESARPQLSDLRESGAIEQDADIVMFIHASPKDDPDEDLEYQGTVELIIAKHRNGPTGSLRLSFRPEINRFDDRMELPAT